MKANFKIKNNHIANKELVTPVAIYFSLIDELLEDLQGIDYCVVVDDTYSDVVPGSGIIIPALYNQDYEYSKIKGTFFTLANFQPENENIIIHLEIEASEEFLAYFFVKWR